MRAWRQSGVMVERRVREFLDRGWGELGELWESRKWGELGELWESRKFGGVHGRSRGHPGGGASKVLVGFVPVRSPKESRELIEESRELIDQD